MNNTIKIAIASFLVGFILGLIVIFALPKKEPQKQIIEVEKYIIEQSEKRYDSLQILLIKSNKKTDSLKSIINEKTNSYKPLERIIINDSIRTNNVSRFFK